MGDLKPCPFCGGEAKFICFNDPEDSPYWNGKVIRCGRCGASTAVAFSVKEPAPVHLEPLWNRRQEPASDEPSIPDGFYKPGSYTSDPNSSAVSENGVTGGQCEGCREGWPRSVGLHWRRVDNDRSAPYPCTARSGEGE